MTRRQPVDASVLRAAAAVLSVGLLLFGTVIVSVAALAVGALLGLVALTLFLVRIEDRRYSGKGSS